MEGFVPENLQEPEEVKVPWYRFAGKAVSLSLLGLVILGVIVFVAFFIYYAWQIKFGDLEDRTKLVDTFEVNFTVDSSLSGGMLERDFVEDYQQYIRNYSPVFGSDNAKVTILTFVDFECPFCKESYSDFKLVMEKYESIVQVVFKNLPLVSLLPEAMSAAQSAMCSSEQNKFWQYHDRLLTGDGLSEQVFTSYAKNIGLDENKFNTCLSTEKYKNQILQDISDAIDLGLLGTPTYIVNGIKVEGSLKISDWDKIILNFL